VHLEQQLGQIDPRQHPRDGTEGPLPLTAPSTIGVVPGVQRVSPTATLPGAVYRTDRVPVFQSGGIGLRAADPSLLGTLNAGLLQGAFLNAATGRYPVAVLGYGAAQSLGIGSLDQPVRIWSANRWFTVAGILQPVQLAPEIDRSVLVGLDYATSDLGFDGYPTRLYVRADPDRVVAIGQVLHGPPTRRARTRSRWRGPRTRWRPGWRCRARRRRCSSAWAQSHSWSAASGWPT